MPTPAEPMRHASPDRTAFAVGLAGSDHALLAKLTQALRRVRAGSPGNGPGWSICFEDRDGCELLSARVDSYQQVQDLAALVDALGFAPTILDHSAPACDFVFRPAQMECPKEGFLALE